MGQFNDLFVQLVRDTSKTHERAPHKAYHNLVSKGHYTTSWLLSGRKAEDTFQLGHTLKATLYAKKISTVQRHGGGKLRVDYTNAQPGVEISSEFSWQTNHMGWNEDEVEANLNPMMGPKYVRAMFQEILDGKRQNLNQDCLDEFESSLWLPADQTAMEAGDKAKSIPYYINEEGYMPLQSDGSNITSINGVTATTAPNYDNQRLTYSAATDAGIANPDGSDLLGRLLGMARRCHFQPLPIGAGYGTKEEIPSVVLCSQKGMDYAQAQFRHAQDQWSKREETPLGFKFGGLMFQICDELDTAALYDDGSSGLATESAADITGPRFYFINRNALCMKFQTGKFMRYDAPTNLTAGNYPYEWVQVVKTKHQLWGVDRRKLGIVSPAASV